MSRNYSVEDVETLRSKGGVSYEEAIRLLDKYDGDLASALIELEKRGQLHKNSLDGDKIGDFIRGWWNKGMESRVLIDRKGRTLVDLPLLVMILLILCAPRAAVVAAVILLISGGHILLDVPREETGAVTVQEPKPAPAKPEEEPGEENAFDRITIE